MLAAPASADTLALGPHGGICADCRSDHMHWLGGGLEAAAVLQWESDIRGATPFVEIEGGALFAFGL